VKFALCNEIMKEFEIEKQFEIAAEIGFDALEIAPFTLNDWVQEITEEQKERIRQASADTGVAAGGHSLAAGGPDRPAHHRPGPGGPREDRSHTARTS
jgi:sugar phosphate isomerase/epimerase